MFDIVSMEEVTGKGAGVDVSLCSNDELLAAAVGFERVRSLIDVAGGHVLAELERRGVCEDEFGHTTKTWLARENAQPPTAPSEMTGARRGGRPAS
jgi:hypothetical protein